LATLVDAVEVRLVTAGLCFGNLEDCAQVLAGVERALPSTDNVLRGDRRCGLRASLIDVDKQDNHGQ